ECCAKGTRKTACIRIRKGTSCWLRSLSRRFEQRFSKGGRMARGGLSRRKMMQAASAAALASSAELSAAMPEPRFESKDTPKMCLDAGSFDEASARRVKQLGVDHVLSGGPPIPWEESAIRDRMEKCRAAGLSLGNLMIAGFPNAIYGRPGRDE